MIKINSTTLLILALLLIPLAIWVEDNHAQLWLNRLIWPDYLNEINRHTPLHSNGTFLPPIINQNMSFGPQNNPIILSFNTTISPNTTLTFLPGAKIYAHEFTSLTIDGRLNSQGSTSQPITFITNEQHELNQVWNGLTINPDGQASINHTNIDHATPAISCLPNSQADITEVNIESISLGLFTASSNCAISDSTIRSTDNGIIAIDVEPNIKNVTFFSRHDIVKQNK